MSNYNDYAISRLKAEAAASKVSERERFYSDLRDIDALTAQAYAGLKRKDFPRCVANEFYFRELNENGHKVAGWGLGETDSGYGVTYAYVTADGRLLHADRIMVGSRYTDNYTLVGFRDHVLSKLHRDRIYCSDVAKVKQLLATFVRFTQ